MRTAIASTARRAQAEPRHQPRVDVEVVIPVYNEEEVLARTVLRLHRFLSQELPCSWRIAIADNGSTDATPEISSALAGDLAQVRLVRIEQKGRGRALRAAWATSDARVVAYMDADLSTDLRALLPLVAPLLSGHSQVAIGTRLARGAQVKRGFKRTLISRVYNGLLRTILRARFSDAQCGFKAVRADVLRDLLNEVKDESWFFDT
ncbi:MAG TPA: glycosyltransferase, partial [Solirubrobacteraceae bacterium]|nr:glycosyltransferase [Solirubrobacteraceae bacterium]